MEPFVLGCCGKPGIDNLCDITDLMAAKDDRPSVNRCALRMTLQDELGDNAKVRASATDAKEQVGILFVTGSQNATVRQRQWPVGSKEMGTVLSLLLHFQVAYLAVAFTPTRLSIARPSLGLNQP